MVLLTSILASGSGDSFWEQLVSWYENSTLYEIIAYLEERYFSLEFGAYENFSVSSEAGVMIRQVIFGVAIGLVIASAMIAFTRTKLGGFVRKLLKQECLSPETAKTLDELGFFRDATIRRELSRGVTLRKVVYCREEEEYKKSNDDIKKSNDYKNEVSSKEQKFQFDFTTAHFYIPEELKYRAEIRFDRKGSNWLIFFGSVVIAVVFAALLCWLLPDLMQMADNLLSMMAPQA